MLGKEAPRLVLFLLTCVGLSLAQCPEGWTSAGFHCYKSFADPASWNEAESHCQSFSVGESKAHVTSVMGIPENVLLQDWLKTTGSNITETWLGLEPVDNAEEVLDDKWSDGGHADLAIWIEEGVLDEEFMFMTKKCLVLDITQGIWLPQDCKQPHPFVCKLSTCPNGWFAHGGRCYHEFTAKKPWVHAEKHCRSFAKTSDANLVGIADAMLNRFLLTILKHEAEPFWIGLKGINADGITTTWSEDQNFNLADVEKGAKNGTCVEVHSEEELSWEDAPCTHERPYVCQLSHCRRGWTPMEGTCMWYTTVPKEHPVSTTSSNTHHGKKRVRRGFGGNFNNRKFKTTKFSRPMSGFGTQTKTQRKTTTFGTKTVGNQQYSPGHAPPPGQRQVITRHQGSRKTTTTKTTTRTVMSQLSNGPSTADVNNQLKDKPSLKLNDPCLGEHMRCIGGWDVKDPVKVKQDPCLCERTFALGTPMKLDKAQHFCMTFTLTGDDKKKSRGQLDVSAYQYRALEEPSVKPSVIKCTMNKVKRIRLI